MSLDVATPYKMPMTQVRLAQGTRQTTCWVKADKRLRPGVEVSLKGKDGRWKIEAVYATMEKESLHTDWNVGGNTRHDR
jgi:hypothetical protein